jgi:chromosomal replication initiation ATPase DnaA
MSNAAISSEKIFDMVPENKNGLYNVVYLYGAVDATGKLIDRIAEEVKAQNPDWLVVQTTGTAFCREFISGIRCGEISAWQKSLQGDVLLLDDIEAVAGHESMEQFLYGLLDWYLERKKQIVVAGQVPLKDISNLAPRICAQLSGGISFFVE